jgi:hypothetical protein
VRRESGEARGARGSPALRFADLAGMNGRGWALLRENACLMMLTPLFEPLHQIMAIIGPSGKSSAALSLLMNVGQALHCWAGPALAGHADHVYKYRL